MDVLTGGGLGDLFRKWIFKNKKYTVESPLLISLGFRRLLYNPYAFHVADYGTKRKIPRLDGGD